MLATLILRETDHFVAGTLAGVPRHKRSVGSRVPPVATSALRKQIASGETGPLYALVGGDDMEKSAVAAEFAEMVDEGLRAFNVERMWRRDEGERSRRCREHAADDGPAPRHHRARGREAVHAEARKQGC